MPSCNVVARPPRRSGRARTNTSTLKKVVISSIEQGPLGPEGEFQVIGKNRLRMVAEAEESRSLHRGRHRLHRDRAGCGIRLGPEPLLVQGREGAVLLEL